MKRKGLIKKKIAGLLVVTMLAGLGPTEVWAEAVNQIGGVLANGMNAWTAGSAPAAVQEIWQDGADKTQAPQFYTFNGDQILEERPEMGETKGGAGGAQLRISDSVPIFPSNLGHMTLSWTDSLRTWVNAQAGTPVNPPSGYTVTVDVKEVQSGTIHKLVDGRVDSAGLNQFTWYGKDATGKLLPDGFYYWRLSASPLQVSFSTPSSIPGGAPTITPLAAPEYSTEYQMIVLDRTGPEVIGVHPLGDNSVAVETRDLVGGLKKLVVQGAVTQTKEWTTTPLRTALSVQPGEAETLRIKAQDIAGNITEETLPLYPYIPGGGSEDYVPNTEATVGGQDVRINLATGNGTQKFDGLTQPGPGVDLDVFFTYNHQNRLKGPLGYGWSFNLDSRLNKWDNDNITWQGFDGTLYWFKKENDSYTTYVNGQQQYYPKMTMDPNADNPDDLNAFVMEWPDQLRYRFKNDGRFWLIQDRDQNEIFFSWSRWHTYHGYDNRIESVKDTNGHLVEFQYQPNTGDLQSTVITELDGIGNTTLTKKKFYFMYNAAGDFVGYRDPSQKIIRFVYDELKRVNQVIDNGNNVREQSGATEESVVTDWTYDGHNRVTRMGMTRGQDGQEEFVGVEYGTKEAIVKNPLGEYSLKWNDAYRLIERKETVQTAGGEEQAVTSYQYSANNLVRKTDPLNASYRYRYNDKDSVTAEQSPSGRIVHYDYDNQQDMIRETGPLGHDISYSYLKNGRKIVSKTTTIIAVDPVGINPEQTIVTKEEYGLKGLLTKRTDGSNNVFEYTYDENGFLTKEGTPNTYVNDLLGNRVQVITDVGTADEAETVSTFNDVGWLMHRTNPTGLIEDFEYDNWGRLIRLQQIDNEDSTKKIVRTYHYDDGGHLFEESDGLTKTTYTLDGMGNVVSQTTVPVGDGTPGKLEEKFVYNSRGLVVKYTDIRGETTETQYDKAGNPTKTVVTPDEITTEVIYDGAGRQKTLIAADGGRTEFVYDAWDRVIEQKMFIKPVFPGNISASAASLAELTAVTNNRYDSAGRLIEVQQPNESWTRYTFDGEGQVVETAVGGLTPQWNGTSLAAGTPDTLYPGHETLSRQHMTYDKLGRTLSVDDGIGNTVNYKYEGRTVETQVPTLDENGQSVVVVSKQSFDSDGRLTRTVSESSEEFTTVYDAFGNEVQSINEEDQKTVTKSDAYGRISKVIRMLTDQE